MGNTVRLSRQDFILAKVQLPQSKTKKQIAVIVPDGCKLYYFGSKNWECVDKGTNEIKSENGLLYWIKDRRSISFPVGFYFADLKKGISFQVEYQICPRVFYENHLADLPLDIEIRDESTYAYLVNYFMDKKTDKPNGLAIKLRDLVKRQIGESVRKILEKQTGEQLRKELEDYLKEQIKNVRIDEGDNTSDFEYGGELKINLTTDKVQEE